MEEKIIQKLASFKQQIQEDHWEFLRKDQLTNREAMRLGDALREAGVPPFSAASSPEVRWAIHETRYWMNYHGPILGYDLNFELGVEYSDYSGAHIAPIMAALGAAVYEYTSDRTGEVDWIILTAPGALRSEQTAKTALRMLHEQGVASGSNFKQITKETHY